MRKLYIFAFLTSLLFIGSEISAQSICTDPDYEQGGFTLPSYDICHNEGMTASNTAAVENPVYYHNYRGESYDEVQAQGSTNTTIDFNSITKTNVYTVIQVGKKNGKETVACREVKVRYSNTPVFSYNVCTNPNIVEIVIPNHSINDYSNYQVDLNGTITTLPPSTTTIRRAVTVPANQTSVLKVTGIGGSKTCNIASPSFPISTFNSGGSFPYYPEITELKVLQDKSVQIDFKGQYETNYNVYRYTAGGPNFGPAVLQNVTPGRFINIPTPNNQSYCYYVQATNNTNCGLFSLRSADICTVVLNDNPLPPPNTHTQNNLTFSPYQSGFNPNQHSATITPVTTVEIQKIIDGSLQGSIPVTIANGNYSDIAVNCSKKFCYRIRVTNEGSINRADYKSISYSNEICIEHKIDPLASPNGVFVSSDDGLKNLVKFDDNVSSPYPVKEWILLKEGGGGFIDYITVPAPLSIPAIEDSSPITKAEAYKLRYIDECENESDHSSAATSAFLSENGSNTLQWTNGNPFSDGRVARFEIIYMDENKTAFDTKQENVGSAAHTIDISRFSSVGNFVLKAISTDGRESLSNLVSIPIQGKIFLPTAFTPNNDGYNEAFKPEGTLGLIQDFKMEIFTPNGKKVVEVSDLSQGWDGKFADGKAATPGGYLYIVTAILTNGQTLSKNGSFTILR